MAPFASELLLEHGFGFRKANVVEGRVLAIGLNSVRVCAPEESAHLIEVSEGQQREKRPVDSIC